MASAAAAAAETIRVKTATASSSCATNTHVIKHPNQFALKTCFSLIGWVLEIYDAPSAAKEEKSLAPGEPICPA